MSRYIKVEDVMSLINTSNRGSCDYFIVDKIEELCNSDKVYDIDKVVEELEEYKRIAFINGIMGIDVANKMIEIVKGGGVNDD